MKSNQQLPNWSSRPPEPEPATRQPGKGAVVVAKFGDKLGEYLVGVTVFAVMTAAVAYMFMIGVGQMHSEQPWVPSLSYWFCWSFTWTASVLCVWFTSLANRGD